MSFVVAAALAIGLLIAIPIAAHLLRRGKTEEQEFPPAALVASKQVIARQRSRLEDRLLLALRGAIVLALAMLGATPLVRCSRLSLTRHAGASVALALVLDDSLSMRASLPGGGTRWEHAKRAALKLLRSAREGDAISVVLAGKPARLGLAATTDLSAARAAVDSLEPSDRATELDSALALARSSLKPLPHSDKRVALLTDFGDPHAADFAGAWVPLPSLAEAVDNCGIAGAEVRGRRVSALVACTTARAARDRSIEVVSTTERSPISERDGGIAGPAAGAVLTLNKLAVTSGSQTATLELPTQLTRIDVRLTGTDALKADDTAPVAPEASALLVGVVSDAQSAGVSTGGGTALEQALSALGSDAVIRPLSLIPDDEKELGGYAALILDDPAGLGPEVRNALSHWLARGGVGVAFLGPKAATAELGATLEPFAQHAVRWELTGQTSVDAASLGWLGNESESLTDLGNKSRTRFDPAELQDARQLARFADREPFLLERAPGHGLLLTFALPTSVSQSDFALRPAFLALLDHALTEARTRTGARRTLVGTPWSFPATSSVEITGPDGQRHKLEPARSVGSQSDQQLRFVPELHGRYALSVDGERQERIVTLDPSEIQSAARAPQSGASAASKGSERAQVNASPELALGVLALFLVELAYRAIRRTLSARRGHASQVFERSRP